MIATGKLARLVVRIDPALNIALADLTARLFEETRVEHSHAAIVRGLVAIGLASIADAKILAPLFVGARIPRGRKRGTRSRTRTADARRSRPGARRQSGGRRTGRAMSAPRFSLTEQEQARAEALLVTMKAAAPPGAQITIATVIHAALARGFAALSPELDAAPKHWASLDRVEDEDAPPESSERSRRIAARPALVVALRPERRTSVAPTEPLASAEAITAARTLIGLAQEAAIVSAEERAAFDARIVPGVLLSTVRALAFDLAMAGRHGSAVERAGRALLAELPREAE